MDDKELGKTEKQEGLTRRSFLKILGTSLLSHFVFLNLSKKSWATSDAGLCSEPTVPDDCGKLKDGKPISDQCGSTGPKGDVDKCGQQSGAGGAIPDQCGQQMDEVTQVDNCNVASSNYDKCGKLDDLGYTIPDKCSTANSDPDKCGQKNAGGSIISDQCSNKFKDMDKCGQKDAAGNIIPDTCSKIDTNEDKCGRHNSNGQKIPDICKPDIEDDDKCGDKNIWGEIIPDLCNIESSDPDKPQV